MDEVAWNTFDPLFLDPPRTRIDAAFSNEGLHLSGKGYLVWRDAIEQLVAKR